MKKVVLIFAAALALGVNAFAAEDTKKTEPVKPLLGNGIGAPSFDFSSMSPEQKQAMSAQVSEIIAQLKTMTPEAYKQFVRSQFEQLVQAGTLTRQQGDSMSAFLDQASPESLAAMQARTIQNYEQILSQLKG